MANKKCIVLNKCFYGNWQQKEENIAHELINFFRADNDIIYIYNNPYGQNISNANNYDVDYLLFTSSGVKKFYIEYCVEITKPVHKVCWKNDKKENLDKKIQEAYKQIAKNKIDLDKITYANISIEKLFKKEDKAVPFTFIADKIYKAKNPIKIELDEDQYNYQRNMGKILSNINVNEYNLIMNKINNKNLWEEYEIKQLECTSRPQELEYIKQNKFIDLIDGFKYEECYTKILSKLFKAEPRLINKIYKTNLDTKSIKIYDEYKTKEGRIDILIHDNNNLLVIENKIDSNITFNDKNESQLNRYYRWAMDNPVENYKFTNIKFIVLSPQYRYDALENELKDKTNDSYNVYSLKSYKDIYDNVARYKFASKDKIITKYLNEIKAMLFRLSLTYFEYNKLRLENRIFNIK